MTSRRTVFSHFGGNIMTSKQPTATATGAGIERRRPTSLDTMARGELGLDPDEPASPLSAAISSLLWLTLGAVVMVLPHMFDSSMAALSFAIALACVDLFAVGAAIGLLNGRGAMRSGTRLLLIGGAAVLLVFVFGHLVGASVAG